MSPLQCFYKLNSFLHKYRIRQERQNPYFHHGRPQAAGMCKGGDTCLPWKCEICFCRFTANRPIKIIKPKLSRLLFISSLIIDRFLKFLYSNIQQYQVIHLTSKLSYSKLQMQRLIRAKQLRVSHYRIISHTAGVRRLFALQLYKFRCCVCCEKPLTFNP